MSETTQERHYICPACGDKALPAVADTVWDNDFPGAIIWQSTCKNCGSTRTIAKQIDGVMSVEVES